MSQKENLFSLHNVTDYFLDWFFAPHFHFSFFIMLMAVFDKSVTEKQTIEINR